MKVTLAICTWNRARLLDQTLESISQLDLPPKVDWELIVVDNNSTEPAVPFVLDDWKKKLPLRVFIENEQGHSAARNCAIKNSTGDYIIWTDNDVLVAKNWLKAYLKSFRDHPGVAFFGGPILPVFESEEPKWINETWDICAPVFATRDLGNKPIELGADRLPYGANFAIRADIQKKFLYDTKWGRKLTAMVGEDEVAVLHNVVQSGETGLWVPDAKLKHFIPDDRATEEYVGAYYFGQGFTNALKAKISRSRFWIWFDAIKSGISYRFHRMFSKPRVWVSRLVHANICQGELAGLKHAKHQSSNRESD